MHLLGQPEHVLIFRGVSDVLGSFGYLKLSVDDSVGDALHMLGGRQTEPRLFQPWFSEPSFLPLELAVI